MSRRLDFDPRVVAGTIACLTPTFPLGSDGRRPCNPPSRSAPRSPTTDGSPSLEPRNLIAFTFTEKAAGELKERITARVHDSLGEVPGLAEMFVGTIHGFCLDLLRNEVPPFVGCTVLDEVAQRMLVERHPERSGRAGTRTLWDAELTPWKDTGVCLNTLDVLRQADLVPEKLPGNSAVEGLAAWRAGRRRWRRSRSDGRWARRSA